MLLAILNGYFVYVSLYIYFNTFLKGYFKYIMREIDIGATLLIFIVKKYYTFFA